MSETLPPFQRFLDTERDVVWRFLVASVGHSEADDCFQETFISALRAYPRLRADSNLRAWVLTIAHRKALDAHRGRARRALPVAEPAAVQDERATSMSEHDGELWDAVGELPERQRSAVTLRFMADLPHREIAAAIGCSEDAARRSLHEGAREAEKGCDGMSRAAAQAALHVAKRAIEEGLVDVSYATVDSPFGSLLAASTEHGLVRLAFPEENVDTVLERLAQRISPRIVEAPAPPDQVRRELDEYFSGNRREFELALDWSLIGPFGQRVLHVTADIPYGGVLSYTEVAAEAGSPRGSRAAGNALGSNPIPIVIPCHRVLRTGGSLGGYGGGLDRKRFLLELEGALTTQLEDDS